jgi:hypothetical protein
VHCTFNGRQCRTVCIKIRCRARAGFYVCNVYREAIQVIAAKNDGLNCGYHYRNHSRPCSCTPPTITIIPTSFPTPQRNRSQRTEACSPTPPSIGTPSRSPTPPGASPHHRQDSQHAFLQDLAFSISGHSRQDNRTRRTDGIRGWSWMAHSSVLGWKDR